MKKRKITGIYKITSPSGRVYIGYSTDIRKRWLSHKYFHTKRICRLYNSFKKYGVDSHVFEVIEECEVDKLKERERYWQDYYNVLCQHKGLNCRLTGTKDRDPVFSKETRKKMSDYMRTRPVKESSRKKWSEQRKGGGNGRAIMVINLETGIYYDCIKDAAKTINVTKKTLGNRLQGIQYNHTSFRYVHPEENDILIKKCNVKPNSRGENNIMSYPILNTETGIYYSTLREAGESMGLGWKPIFDCIHGKAKRRKLPFIKA